MEEALVHLHILEYLYISYIANKQEPHVVPQELIRFVVVCPSISFFFVYLGQSRITFYIFKNIYLLQHKCCNNVILQVWFLQW